MFDPLQFADWRRIHDAFRAVMWAAAIVLLLVCITCAGVQQQARCRPTRKRACSVAHQFRPVGRSPSR